MTANVYINEDHPYSALYDIDAKTNELVLTVKDRLDVRMASLEVAIIEYQKVYKAKPVKLIEALTRLRHEDMAHG